MDTRANYKDRALASLKGNWDKGIIATLIYLVVEEVGSLLLSLFISDPIVQNTMSFVWALICLPISWGFSVFFLRLVRGEDLGYKHIFDGFNDAVRIICTYLLAGLIILVGTILLIVPGIIAFLMFSQISFIMKDDQQIGVIDTLKQSANMMRGHKMDYFLLMLSFIGWAILSIITLGLGFFFLLPYVYTTTAHFYEDLKAEQAW